MARWLIDMAGVQVTVVAKDARSHELVETALSAMDTEQVGSSVGIKLTLKYHNGFWELCDHSNKLERKLEQTGDVIYHLTDRIVFHIADKAQNVHCLHAASVARDGRAIVVPANSGAGKSTFTTWLAANDFDYLTDELILVNDQGDLSAVSRPIQIKSHGLNAIEHLLKEPSLVHKGKYANALPIECLGANKAQGKQVLGLFVFPKYSKGGEFSFKKLSGAEAGMRLMANHVNARNLEGHGFKAMMALIKSTPSYALEYGGFDALSANFCDLLTNPLQASSI